MPVEPAEQYDRVRDPEGGDRAQPLHRVAEEEPAVGRGAVRGALPAVVCPGISGVCWHGVLGNHQGKDVMHSFHKSQ